MSNAYASNYVQSIVCTVAGFYSAIDPKSAIWNKGLNLTQIPGLSYTPTQLDALTQAKVNVLRYKGANTAPVLLHDRTAAIIDSDFTFVLRMNIHDLVISTIYARADQYEGQSTLDGLQMTSMKSAMDEDMVALTKRGYISKSNITISATQVQQNTGKTVAAAGHTRCLLPVAQQTPRARASARYRCHAQTPPPGERPLPSPFRPFFDGD
jgi:hypothetical protein